MGKLEQYVTKDTKKEREPVYAQENSKTLQGYNAAQTLSGNELIDKYQKRIQGDTTFEDRTRYYFEDYHLMDSKVKRYRNMAKDERGLQSYSHTYNNHKASKRKDFANAAADKFEAASKLALSLDESKTKGFALYQHREKIMRLRMSGMENAAKAKSVSSDDEAYKILKGKLSCLSILKDQLEVMGQDESLSAQEIVQFKEAKARIDSELEGVKNSLMSREKIHVKTWERENGLDDSSIRTKLRNEQRTHPYVKSEAVKLAGIMNRLDADDKRMEYEDTVPDMLFRHPAFKDRKDNRADIENVDSMNRETVERFGRILRQPCRVVLRDRNGLPVSHAERRKEEWNKKWLNAVKNRDKDTINSMLKESFERFEKMEFPSPEELRSKGIMYFYKKDPAAFHEMMRFTSALDEMAEANDFAKEYRDSHELFRKKTRMALCMSSMLRNEIAQSRYMINKTGNGYGFVDIRNQAQYREYRLGDEAKANAIQRDLAKYTADHQSIQEAYRTAKTEDMKKAEEHTDTVNDMKGELDLTIKELRREKARSGKTISPELEELDKDIVGLESQLRNKIPLAETADREKGFDYTILMIEAMYNRVSSSVDRCLAKSSSYKGLRHGRLMLDKMKRQCAAEIGAFRSAAVEYRRAIQEGSIGPFDKGQEPTWRDALNYTRSVKYDLDKKGEDALNRMIMERKDGPALLQSGMETEKKTEKKTIPPLSKQEQEQIKQLEKMEAMQRQQYENEQRQLRTLFEKGKGKQIKLQSRYDRQGTNNCFACSGTALLNHFIAKNRKLKPGEKLPQYNQYDMRNINPDEYVQSYAESWENYNSEAQYSNEVSQLKHMVGPGTSGLMEIFELGDFFLREEKDLMIHQKKIHVDYENKRVFDAQKKAFADQVKEVLDSGEPVALFEGSHYVTITGLKGNIIEYMDSNDDTQEEGKPITKPRYATIDDIFSREKTRGAIGITWLSKLKDPKDIVKDFQYLGHNGKEFYSRDTDGDTYNLTHKHGLTGVKEMGNGITYDIYVPKNSAPISKTGSDMNIIMEEPEEEEIIEKHSIQRKSSNIKKEKPAGKNDILVEVGNRTYNEVNKLDKAVTEKAYRVLMEKRECEDYILKNPEVKDAYKKATENIKEWSTTLDRNALYVMKYVKMDKNGNPATKEDRINHEWNIKWLKAFHNNDPKSLQTREDMLGEQIGHVMDEFLLPKDPTPEMLKDEAAFKKHIDSWIENTLMKEGNFAKLLFINKCPYSYDGLKLVMPGIKGFLENNKALQAKEDVMTAIMSYANSYILLKYHIQMEKDSVVRFSKDETGAIRQNNEMLGQVGLMTLMGIYSNYLSVDRKKAIVPYKKALVPVEEKKKEGKKETGNDSSQKKNKESYEINPNISLEEFLKADPSLTGEAYDIFMGHIKAKAVGKNNPVMKNEYQKIVDGNKKHQWLNIDRDAGYMLKYVNYDKNNKPLTKVDQENHEWNLRWFQCLQKEDKKSLQTRKQMTTQYASHIYDDLPLPPMPAAGQEKDVDSYMKVLQDWAESILKDQDAFAKLEFVCDKTLSFDNMSKAIPGLKTYKTKNKKFEAKQNMALALGTYIKTYISKKYGMDVSGQRVFAGKTRENWVKQADGALKIYAQVFMDAYRQYNEHKNDKEVPYK